MGVLKLALRAPFKPPMVCKSVVLRNTFAARLTRFWVAIHSTLGSAADTPTFEILTTPNSKQKRALELIAQIKMKSVRGTKISGGFIGKTRLF